MFTPFSESPHQNERDSSDTALYFVSRGDNSDWEAVKNFCLQHFQDPDSAILESGPTRELDEEFTDALGIKIAPAQYVVRSMRTIIEHQPTRTNDVRAPGQPTARIYRTFEAHIEDPELVAAIMINSEICSDRDLQELALKDARNGGRGRANAVLALPIDMLTSAYTSISPEERIFPITFRGHRLAGNVPAILENVTAPQYRMP